MSTVPIYGPGITDANPNEVTISDFLVLRQKVVAAQETGLQFCEELRQIDRRIALLAEK